MSTTGGEVISLSKSTTTGSFFGGRASFPEPFSCSAKTCLRSSLSFQVDDLSKGPAAFAEDEVLFALASFCGRWVKKLNGPCRSFSDRLILGFSFLAEELDDLDDLPKDVDGDDDPEEEQEALTELAVEGLSSSLILGFLSNNSGQEASKFKSNSLRLIGSLARFGST